MKSQSKLQTQTLKVTLPALHPTQVEVQTSKARFRVLAAGRRWGKGVLGVGECVKRAGVGKRCWWVTPSFASAAYQAGWRMLEFYAARIPAAALFLQRRMLAFPTGGWVQFKTGEEPDALRGEAIDFCVLDEAAHVPKLREIWELCVRPTLMDRKGEALFVSTPHGFNYFSDLYNRGKNGEEGWASFRFDSKSNPHLDRKELEEITRDMPALVKRQEIGAEFVQLAGALFQRDWVRFIDIAPPGMHWVRSWDLAWTEKTTSDYTAGGKIGMAPDGTIVVAHMIRQRLEWPEAVKLVRDTARLDGPKVVQGIEVVGAQRAFLQTLQREPMLADIALRPIEVTRDKLTRALPLVARAEQSKLAFLRGTWCECLLDELCAFPEGDHDDQVDALTGGMACLATGKSASGIVGTAKSRYALPTGQRLVM